MANRCYIPTDELLVQAAEMRIENKPWEEVGQKLHRKADTVRRWPANYPERWRHAMHNAERRLAIEGEAESLVVLRSLLRSKSSKMRWHAAKSLVALRLDLAKLDIRVLGFTRNSDSPDMARLATELVEGISCEQFSKLVETGYSRAGEMPAAAAGPAPVGPA